MLVPAPSEVNGAGKASSALSPAQDAERTTRGIVPEHRSELGWVLVSIAAAAPRRELELPYPVWGSSRVGGSSWAWGVKAKLELLGGKEPSLGLGNSMSLIWKSLVGKIKYGKSRNHCSCSAFLTVIFFWFRQFNILFLFFFFLNVSLCGIKQGTAACVLPVLSIFVLI